MPDLFGLTLSQLEEAVSGAFMQQMLDRLSQQTFVGGKRVAVQELPGLAQDAATTVHRVKVSLHGSRPPVWRRIEIPSAMRLDLVALREAHGRHHLRDPAQMLNSSGWSRRASDSAISRSPSTWVLRSRTRSRWVFSPMYLATREGGSSGSVPAGCEQTRHSHSGGGVALQMNGTRV